MYVCAIRTSTVDAVLRNDLARCPNRRMGVLDYRGFKLRALPGDKKKGAGSGAAPAPFS